MLSGEILRLSAVRHPGKTALICGGRAWSYAGLDAWANRFANALAGRGLGKGDRVAVMCPNVAEYAAVHFGAARLGCVLVNLSTMYTSGEAAGILAATRARLLVVEAESCAGIAEARDRLPTVETVVAVGAPGKLAATPFDDFTAGAAETPPEAGLADTDPVGMTFTGGTTGRPKGAVVSHRARHISAWTTAVEHELAGDDVVAAVTPLYHAVGLYIWFQAAVLAGCTCVLLRRWDAGAFVELAARRRVSAVMTVPVQLRGLLADGVFDAGKLASLKKIGAGGADLTPALIERCKALLPEARLVDHYGQSETGPLAFLKPWDPPEKYGTVGRPALGVDLRVVGPDGAPVPPGEIGEIAVQGPFLFDGYFEDAEETALYFRGGDRRGWTGDLAVRDAEGYITLAGRSKDMIVSGGVNVYPREVEIVLERHRAVGECTVVGVPDDRWGEALVAYVVPRAGAATDGAALAAFCRERLAAFKRPREILFAAEIPRTPTGKVQKPRLRAAYLAERPPDGKSGG